MNINIKKDKRKKNFTVLFYVPSKYICFFSHTKHDLIIIIIKLQASSIRRTQIVENWTAVEVNNKY